MNKIILFNPRSAHHKYRIPNSILQVGASVFGQWEFVFVDGNMENDPWIKIENYLKTGEFKYFGSTVMPGPQLKQAIPITQKIKTLFPEIVTIWGGYFAANQFKVNLNSGFVDFVINGPGDNAFPTLLKTLEANNLDYLSEIKNLIYKNNKGEIVKNPQEAIPDLDKLKPLPFDYLDSFYPLGKYFGKTFMGNTTIAYHSSFGCPFTCSFCAVVPIYNARWKGKSANLIYEDVKYLKEKYDADAIEFHDNNFFVAEKRVVEFSKLIKNENMLWWGEGRIDTIDKYSDESLALMREAGCKMIFFGAETGNDDILKQMDKGGTQSAEQIKRFAARMKKFDIIPEYSFVLGLPAETPEKVMAQIDADINFIREIKEINPDTEIIIYIYSPVPTEGSELFEAVTKAGFHFPEKLEDWLDPQWEKFDLRKNPLTPWLTPEMVDKIKNFETVLNGYYPTESCYRVQGWKRNLLKTISKWRYKTSFYKMPYEIKLLHKLWKYRQPEIEGF